MEFEIWWLLALPLFFGMGWVAARIDIKSLLSESRAMPTSYFRGLNFLLNEQPDKAIESFLQVAKENPQTVELQFALGSLFRRRGEVDRAIRMTLFTASESFHEATRAREVYDVSGAGDTVIAVLALMVAAGADLHAAMRVSNHAAGIVVGKLGTAVAHRDELEASLAAT